MAITIFIVLRATGVLRLWGSVIGAVAGCLVAASFGIYNMDIVGEALWFGVPAGGMAGLRPLPEPPSSGRCCRPSCS